MCECASVKLPPLRSKWKFYIFLWDKINTRIKKMKQGLSNQYVQMIIGDIKQHRTVEAALVTAMVRCGVHKVAVCISLCID